MCLYYFIFLRLIRQRPLKFSPKIVTSQKSHGKWGDFIVCLVPIAWCANILSNSNFIMRMIEWQTESSLFTVRIRGRQWYWVYKIELKDLIKVTTFAKNVGHDYWEIFENIDTGSIAQTFNNLQIRTHNKEYLSIYKKKIIAMSEHNVVYHTSSYDINEVAKKKTPLNNIIFEETLKDLVIKGNHLSSYSKIMRVKFIKFLQSNECYKQEPITVDTNNTNPTLNFPKFDMQLAHNASDANKRFGRIANFTIPVYTALTSNTDIIDVTWNNSSTSVSAKTTADNLYFVIKQKRFAAPIRKINTVNILHRQRQFMLNNFTKLTAFEEFIYTRKWAAKRLKYKSSVIPLAFNKRLLRTRRVLVLPSQVNITLITNSFDVVHSWYIPGLGIKLDCIPGRSTHHTIFIDHAGFYYGQCAEICGRYHHHMPIRVCALPFEHFLIWWYHYGLPYFNALSSKRKVSIKAGLKQYTW